MKNKMAWIGLFVFSPSTVGVIIEALGYKVESLLVSLIWVIAAGIVIAWQLIKENEEKDKVLEDWEKYVFELENEEKETEIKGFNK